MKGKYFFILFLISSTVSFGQTDSSTLSPEIPNSKIEPPPPPPPPNIEQRELMKQAEILDEMRLKQVKALQLEIQDCCLAINENRLILSMVVALNGNIESFDVRLPPPSNEIFSNVILDSCLEQRLKLIHWNVGNLITIPAYNHRSRPKRIEYNLPLFH